MELPEGWVFSPSHEDIFREYLKPLIQGNQDDYLKVIYKTDEVYGDKVDIERTFGKALRYHREYVNEHIKDDDHLWFFTKLKRLGTSNRFERKSGELTWTTNNTGKFPLYEDKRESLIGKVRNLALTVKEESGLSQGIKAAPKRRRVSASATKDVDNSANWIMHEFFFEKQDGKQYTDYVIVKIRRKGNTPSSSSSSSSSSQQVVHNEAASAQSAYQHQFHPSDYQHETTAAEDNLGLPQASIVDSLLEDQQIDCMYDTAAPTPSQDESQQGEHNWDFYPDTLMEELLEASNVDIQQDVVLISDSDDEAGLEERIDHEPVATDDCIAVQGDYQRLNQEGLGDILVTSSEAEAVQKQQDIRDGDFSMDLECLLSEVQPEKEFSDKDYYHEASATEYNWELQQGSFLDSLMEDQEGSYHNQEGLSDILVTGSEAETHQDNCDEEFSDVQPEKEVSDEDLRSLNFWLSKKNSLLSS